MNILKSIFVVFIMAVVNASALDIVSVTKDRNSNRLIGNLVMGSGGVLTLERGSTLNAYGTIANSGTFNNTGAINNSYLIDNTGTIRNFGTFSGSPSSRIEIGAGSLSFGGISSQASITTAQTHGFILRSPNWNDGIPLVAWSSSGAPAAKLVQDTRFTSPTLTVWRDLSNSGDISLTPSLLLAATGGSATTQSAFEITPGGGLTNFKITWNGMATSRDKPLCRYLGSFTSNPSGNFGTDLSVGDIYFNTANNKVYILDGTGWKSMTP